MKEGKKALDETNDEARDAAELTNKEYAKQLKKLHGGASTGSRCRC